MPTKFVPLSDLIDLILPRFAIFFYSLFYINTNNFIYKFTNITMNLIYTLIGIDGACLKESVSIVKVTSICTALLAKYVNKAQYCSRFDLLPLMVNGPKMSTPQRANGATSQHLSFGKSDIFWSPYVPYSFLHVTHLWMILLTIVLALSTQMPFFSGYSKSTPFHYDL